MGGPGQRSLSPRQPASDIVVGVGFAPRGFVDDAGGRVNAEQANRRARVVASIAVVGTAAALSACGSDATPTTFNGFPVRFIATNALAAPVTIAVDGEPLATLSAGQSRGITVSSKQRSVTWTSAKPTDSRGVPIPDDIGEIAVPVGSLGSTLEIANVIGSDTYVTAEIFNRTATQVSIGVWDGAAVACAAILPAMSGVVNGYVRTGYYRLGPATELRAYRDPTSCTGAYVAWPRAQLAAYVEKSGLVDLALDAAP